MSTATKEEGEGMTALTVNQHKQAVKLGIAHREDGLWGFKKKCVNKKCNKVLETACYATDTFEEAVRESQVRSSYSCGDECWMESGTLHPWIEEQYDIHLLETLGECDRDTVDRLLRRLKNGSTRNLPAKDKKILRAWIEDLKANFDGGDMDENEVGCEV